MMKTITSKLFALAALLFLTTAGHAQLAGWQYRTNITVNDTSGVLQTNHQVRLDVNTAAIVAAGHMQASGDDIRFADSCGTTIYSHYVESGMNTANTIIWLLVPSIPANGQFGCYMYHGNAVATSTANFGTVFPMAFISGGPNTTLTGTLTYDWFQVDVNDTVFVQAGSVLTINAVNVVINGVISGDGRGYQAPAANTAGTGTGGGGTSANSGSGGGSYGGVGGTGGYDAGDTPGTGGPTYGTPTGTDIDMGSSGGSGVTVGGSGGGALSLNSDYVNISATGVIRMTGANAISNASSSRGGGGGSGGAVVMTAGNVVLAGILSANGGNGAAGTSVANDSGGGGGGGRVKAFHSGTLSNTGTTTAAGGTGGPNGTAAPGQPGTAGSTNIAAGGGYDVPVSSIGSESSLQTPTLNLSATAICAGDPIFATATSGFTTYNFLVNGNPVSSGTSNTYTYTGLNNGDILSVSAISAPCFSATSTTTAITVNANSSVGTVTASASLCQGGTDTLNTAGETGAITWYEFDGSNYIPVGSGYPLYLSPMNTAGTFTYVAVADNGACAIDTSFMLTTVVNAAPVAGVVSTTVLDTNLCAFDSILFTANGSSGSIEWFVQFGQMGPYSSFGSGNPYNPGPPSNGDIGGYYFLAVASAPGCPDDTSAPIALYVRETPVVTLGNDTTLCGGMLMLDAGNPGYAYLWNSTATTQTIFATTSGAYDVTVTTPYGCSGSDTVNVTINQQPIVDLGADTSSCGSITLDAGNAGSTYVWSNGPTTQTNTITSSGSYSVFVSSGPGCDDSDSITVTINTPPTVTLSASGTTVCFDDGNVILTGTPAGGTYSGPGVTGNQFDPSAAGNGNQTVTYSYTDVNGCNGTDVVQITVDPCAGVNEGGLLESVAVYPNPNSGTFTIAVNGGEPAALVIEIADITGRVVYSQLENNAGPGFIATINLDKVATGTYFLRLTSGDSTTIEKLLIER